ncbi:metal ABC transporter substrate-binding protein [Avibacterium gallinarum]|uniref:metal ABC transporter substrate-binding protein n=1 Tax=Avibacterium TaxID=292486 RepID=UPI002EDB1892
MLKQFATIALSAAMLFSGASYAKFKVVTTFTIIQDMAQNIAGDAASVESITKAGAEIHGYEPTPKDIVKAQSADLVLWNGLNLERWFERFFQNVQDKPAVVVTSGIQPIFIAENGEKKIPNPHAWMSPSNALIYVENIKNALIKYDPQNAETYRQNAENYAKKIRTLDSTLRPKFDKVPQAQRWLATSEGAFSYLAQDYGFNEVYLWAVNAEQQGTPQQVRKMIDLIRQHQIPVIFSESTISPKPAQQVAKESQIHYGGVLYVDSLSNAKGPVPTYLDLLNTTITTIIEGFENAQ